MNPFDALWNQLSDDCDLLVDNTNTTNSEINLVTTLNGLKQETLDDICFYYTGYRTVSDFREYLNDQGE